MELSINVIAAIILVIVLVIIIINKLQTKEEVRICHSLPSTRPIHLAMRMDEIRRRLDEGNLRGTETSRAILEAGDEKSIRGLLGEAILRGLIRVTAEGAWEYHPPPQKLSSSPQQPIHLAMDVDRIKGKLREPNLRDTETARTILAAENEDSVRELLDEAISRGVIKVTIEGVWEYHPPADPLAGMTMGEIRRKLRGLSFGAPDTANAILVKGNEESVRELLRSVFSRKLIQKTSEGKWKYQPTDPFTMNANEIKRRLEDESFRDTQMAAWIKNELDQGREGRAKKLIATSIMHGVVWETSEGSNWEFQSSSNNPSVELTMEEIKERLRQASFEGIESIDAILTSEYENTVRELVMIAFLEGRIWTTPDDE